MHKDLSPSHSTPACSSEAALFAALFQALKHCAADQRDGILQTLEIRLDTAYDDLDEKAALLLTPNRMSVEDRVYGLWLLYLSVVVFPRLDQEVQAWIGVDVFSNDRHECLRLRGAFASLPEPDSLERDLTMLARVFSPEAQAEARRTTPDQLAVTLHGPSI